MTWVLAVERRRRVRPRNFLAANLGLDRDVLADRQAEVRALSFVDESLTSSLGRRQRRDLESVQIGVGRKRGLADERESEPGRRVEDAAVNIELGGDRGRLLRCVVCGKIGQTGVSKLAKRGS